MSLVSYILIFLFTLILFLFLCISLILGYQHSVLFAPSSILSSKPEIEYSNLYLDMVGKIHDKKPGGKYINLWHFIFNENGQTVLFCHGNSGNISKRSYIIDLCANLKLNLVLFDYRGYGESTGLPNPKSICEDGISVYEYLIKQCNPSNIIVWGESLGGAVATHIASNRKVSRLILMCTFSSLDDVLRYSKGSPWLIKLLKLTTDTLPNKHKISKIKCPIAILHSQNDDIIPYQCGKILYDSISHANKLFIKIDGPHSIPEITHTQLSELLCFCQVDIPDSDYLNTWLTNLSVCIRQLLDP